MLDRSSTRFEIKDFVAFCSTKGVEDNEDDIDYKVFICRRYSVDLETMMIEYSPHSGGGTGTYSLQDVSEVRLGMDTDLFNKIEQQPGVLAR